MNKDYLEVENLYFKYPNANEDTLCGLSFSLPHGAILGIHGASGSGKSTILRLIAGLEEPRKGKITINNKVICEDSIFVEPEKRNIGMVFQDYALFPHLTVEKNILFGVDDKKTHKEILETMLEMVKIKDLAKRYPYELSGGQQQRVTIARTLARKPALLLLDEPFSNLDANLQSSIRTEINEMVKALKVTTIFVSHDTEDVTSISDYIMLFQNGLVEFSKNVRPQ